MKNELVNLEYNFSNIGTIYLTDVIEFICRSNNSIELLSNLEKKVYVYIAQKYDKNQKTIKSDIVKATNKAHEVRCLKYNNKSLTKNTAKTVINQIVDKIKDENDLYCI